MQVRVSEEPSVWGCGGGVCAFRAAKSNHLCVLRYDTGSSEYKLEDLSQSLGLPAVSVGGPVFVDEGEMVWVGENLHLYAFSLATRALVDRTGASGVRVRGGVVRMAKQKVFFANAQNGHLCEGYANGGQWSVVDHTLEHGAPVVGTGLAVDLLVPRVSGWGLSRGDFHGGLGLT
jgi:hypothetical protein